MLGDEEVRRVRGMTLDDLARHASVASGTTLGRAAEIELERRGAQTQLEILESQREAAKWAGTAAQAQENIKHYTRDYVQASLEMAEAAKRTAEYTQRSSRYMRNSLWVLAAAAAIQAGAALLVPFIK